EPQSQPQIPSSPELGLQGASSNEDIPSLNDGSTGALKAPADTPGLPLTNGFAAGEPTLKGEATRACIMAAVSIDTKSNPGATVALKMVSSSMGLALANGAATVAAVTQ
uniref:Uncharacterized protein n=2 Tax=Anopheles albimanus TaxID=7167 RepID=A0A182FDU3_ANOAL